jgi:cell division GTPase FtsZ
VARLQGNLQVQIMHALWDLGAGTVDQVREALAERDRSALGEALADASSEARQAAIITIIGGLDGEELGGLKRRLREVSRRREER